MPNVLRRSLAMTGRVPIIHVADTAFTIGQGARKGSHATIIGRPADVFEASQNDAASVLRAVRPQARNRHRTLAHWPDN